MTNRIIFGDNLPILQGLPASSVDCVYLDPPWATGKVQKRVYTRTERSEIGDRTGFQGERYQTEKIGASAFDDSLTGDAYLDFLRPRLIELHRILKPTGTLYFHGDWHAIHYVKVMLDGIFGREKYLGSVIWAYDFGARTKRRWPQKHNEILHYAKTEHYVHNYDEIDRIPYLAPALVGPEKAALGKSPTSVWWMTIVSPTGHEKLGYATQKPIKLLNRIVRASCPKGGVVLDPFAGSGTTGAAALLADRKFILIDSSDDALRVMSKRFEGCDVVFDGVPEHLFFELTQSVTS